MDSLPCVLILYSSDVYKALVQILSTAWRLLDTVDVKKCSVSTINWINKSL